MILKQGIGEKPLWSQLYEILEAQILSEDYKKGDILPSEKELMEEYSVSRVTVRQAMDKLMVAGLVSRSRGIGTIVIKNDGTIATSFQSSFNGVTEMNNDKDRRVKKIEVIIPPEEVQQHFKIDNTTKVLKLTRVTYLEGKPVTYYETYLNPVTKLTMDIDLSGSMYKVLDDIGYRIDSVKEKITASISNEQEEKLFKCEEKIALMNRIRLGYSQDYPIEFTYSKYVAKGYQLEINLS